ncbi:MAG: D-aminoacyl-tRNA deacylase [Gammaproteobacteria bacterium]|nr:D-aminoacyl-tRNA deacylase [Gammaproteobacteria bacterium]
MIGLLQRVSEASVQVGGEEIARIDTGMLVLVGVQKHDTPATAVRLLERLLAYRVFEDDAGRMNLSLRDARFDGQPGGLLLVPQFTLPADTRKGTRASFTPAAAPGLADELFASLCEQARAAWNPVACGQFGANMRVALVNEGPVTFWLEVNPD